MTGKLVICPTPIGNLGDVTLRTLDALRAADVVCAEDTRVTGKLLTALGIEGKRVERLDEYAMGEKADGIVGRVLAGENIVYCSDAGMPGVSDPGLRLVRAARESGADVEVLPGPTAVATAYVASGCADSSFYFGAFLPRKDSAREELLGQLKALPSALIFYESPRRLASTLASIAKVLPHRRVTVCRELTKLHEEVVCGTAEELLADFGARPSIKGEIAIVIEGPNDAERSADEADALGLAATRAQQLVDGGSRPKEVARMLVEEFGIARNEAYGLAVSAKNHVG